ncbi:MAG: hypothetical protein JWM11_595 [Planctomycetaceae bacterium]|nr:hypothetical protein [Planctomycetaceae bacterium]
MSLFEFRPDETITPLFVPPHSGNIAFGDATRRSGRDNEFVFTSDKGEAMSPRLLQDQFVAFQLNDRQDGPTILESSQVEPSIEGSSEEPDVLATMQLLSFNLGSSEEISPDTRATMRINFGKDENSRDKYFDTAFWSIAAGLKLYDEARGKQTESKDLQVDFRKAFGNRPVEIPGGLSKLSFEVVQHTEPAWLQKIFRFAGSGAAKNLISVLGFPAFTYQAIGVLDELLNKLVDSQPKVLFKSLPMRLALSKQARQDFTAGNPRIRMGCLTAGFCILARARDYDTIADAKAFYYPAYGKLVPNDVSESAMLRGTYRDPFEKLTYSVFRIGTKKTKLDPTFNFGS